VNLSTSDLKMIFFIVKVIPSTTTAPILRTPLLDVLLFGTSSIPMDHACQAALTHTEMNGIMDPTSVILLAPKDTLTP
jgi:hypothetical protein